MNVCLTDIVARPVLVPMRRPLTTGSGAVAIAPLVLIDLHTDAGIIGHAYVFALTALALKPLVETILALKALVVGQRLAPVELDAALRRRFTLLGTPGLLGIALAGLDMAAWDCLAKVHAVPLAVLLGGECKRLNAYNSNGLGLMPPAQVADEAEDLLAEGFGAVKIRLGRPRREDDLVTVQAVRERVGPDVSLMADFNQCLTPAEALLRGRLLDDSGLAWIEEPVRHDDYAGCARLARELRTHIQIGENLLGTMEFAQALLAGACDYVMPDVQRIGGVTGFLRAAALAQAHGMEVSSHLFPEVSAHLLAVTPTCHWLEFVDWAAPVLAEPLEVINGQVGVPSRPGNGMQWNERAVARFAAP